MPTRNPLEPDFVQKTSKLVTGKLTGAADDADKIKASQSSIESKTELSFLLREIKEPKRTTVSDETLEKIVVSNLEATNTTLSGLQIAEEVQYQRELLKNYQIVADSVSGMSRVIIAEQLNLAAILALPARVYGYFTYGADDSAAHPLRNARVFIGGFTTSTSTPVICVECTTDKDGYFEAAMPAGYKLTAGELSFIVTRGKIGQAVSIARNILIDGKGDIGSYRLKKEFIQSEGILERVDGVIYHIKEVLDGAEGPQEDLQGQPKVVLGEEGTEFALTWAGSAVSKYTYKLLHRLIEPELTLSLPVQFDREAIAAGLTAGNQRVPFRRIAINGPIDVENAKNKLIVSPDMVPIMSTLGMGYTLSLRQEWLPTNFSLGTLLYSLPLAPGEEQRIIVTESSESYSITDRESMSEYDWEQYNSSRHDDTQSIYRSALQEHMQGHSDTVSRSPGSGGGSIFGTLLGAAGAVAGGVFGGPAGAMVGGSIAGTVGNLLGGGGGGGNSSTSVNTSQDYSRAASSDFAESFNQRIQRTAEGRRQANRISIRLAGAEESRSVTSKIIANNNHSHALTMQYWEVLRNYTIETKVDDVALVCYIPLKPIRFLPSGHDQILSNTALMNLVPEGEKYGFFQRYDMLLRHYDAILPYMPYKHRIGLTTLKTFATYPRWRLDSDYLAKTYDISLTIKGSFMPYDDMRVYIVLQNGRRIQGQGVMSPHNPDNLSDQPKNRDEVIQSLKKLRNNASSASFSGSFLIPASVKREEFAYLELVPSTMNTYTFVSKYMPGFLAVFASDPSAQNSGLLSAWTKQNTYQLQSSDYNQIGALQLSEITADIADSPSQNILTRNGGIPPAKTALRFSIDGAEPLMTLNQLQAIEETFQHVVENTMHYSMVIWSSLTADERAMLLEPFSIGLPGAGGTDLGAQVPLMNCVTNKIEGFYGNCMIMPFSYTPELADALNTSSKEIQDALFRYHSEAFRAPQTKVSVSTNGMVGEAVLGSSNSSEKIDITRFWNWQDSPIEHAERISLAELNQAGGLLENKTTSAELPGTHNSFQLNNLPAAAAPSHAEVLASKDAASGLNMTGVEQLASIVTKPAPTGGEARQEALSQSSDLTGKVIDTVVKIIGDSGLDGLLF